jgi:transcriptional regulator with XRE-family HTH domain
MSRASTSRLPKVERGSTPSTQNPSTQKLSKLAQRFDGFEDALQIARQKRRDDNEKRFIDLQKQITDLKTSLALEAKNRAISMNAVQSWLTDRIEKWTEEVQAPILAKIAALNDRVTHAFERVENLEEEHKRDRVTFAKMIDDRCTELLVEIRDVKSKMELNNKAREEKEQRIMHKITELDERHQEQFEDEKQLVEERFRVIKTEVENEVNVRIKGIDMLKEAVRTENDAIKVVIERETQERKAANAEMLAAIAHYSAALQDGIKIVGL